MDNTDVLALKHRPRRLADVIGQEAAVTTLLNAFTSGKLPQTFVFAGFFGCGKTSVARILAAMENCEKGRTTEPCGECKNCREIFEGESTDIKEVNAAQNRGIDDIRNIAEYVSTRPLSARVKYVILDECHMLSKEAAESALKLFEEPPDGVRYVLATTDLHKMKGTIQSRCMPFRFVKVPWTVITEHLRGIAAKEGYKVDDAALKIAAKLSDGSVRNSLRNLQLLNTFVGGGQITADLAQQALGAIDDSNYFDILDAVHGVDAASAMKVISSIFSKGLDFQQVFDGLLDHLRTLLVLTTAKNTAGLLFLSEEEKKRYLHQIGQIETKISGTDKSGVNWSIHLFTGMITLLYDVARGVSLNINPQTLMEKFAVESIMTFARIGREAKVAKTT